MSGTLPISHATRGGRKRSPGRGDMGTRRAAAPLAVGGFGTAAGDEIAKADRRLIGRLLRIARTEFQGDQQLLQATLAIAEIAVTEPAHRMGKGEAWIER